MDLIHLESSLLIDIAHAWFVGTAVFLIKSSHLYGTLVKPSTQLCSYLTKVMSANNPYSSTKFVSALNCCLISFLLWYYTLAFLIRVSIIHLCIQVELVKRYNIVASHVNAMLTPFCAVLSSAKFMCCTSLSFCNQLASSRAVPSCFSETPVGRELTSTQTLSLSPLTHHLPPTGSS